MKTFSIAGRPIGPEFPPFVIAEIGVNHDGSARRAMELVDLAAAAGADAVKLQLFTARTLMHDSAAFAGYQQGRVTDANPADMLRRYELSAADVSAVVDRIRRCGLVPIATPFSPADLRLVRDLELPAIKIASPDLVNRPLLAMASAVGVPLLVSTGAATSDEVAAACRWITADFALLHCVSSYPVADQSAHLRWIDDLKQFGVPVGYSDHATDELAGALAVAAGAVVIEKHLTYDRRAAGPDHSASADPQQFAAYVKLIRRAATLAGVGPKHVLDCERDVRTVSRQSLVLDRDVPAGTPIHESDLTVQRPGTGIPAADVQLAVGRKPRRPLGRGTLLQWDMLADAA